MNWPSRRGTSLAITGVAIGLVSWWALVFALVSVLLTGPAAPVRAELPPDFTITVGRLVHLHARGFNGWSIPVNRLTYEAYIQAQTQIDPGVRDFELASLTHHAWISVSDRLTVRVVEVDGEAVQVELVEGRNTGRRGWLSSLELDP